MSKILATQTIANILLDMFDAELIRLEKAGKCETPRWKRFRERKRVVQQILELSTKLSHNETTLSDIIADLRREYDLHNYANTHP